MPVALSLFFASTTTLLVQGEAVERNALLKVTLPIKNDLKKDELVVKCRLVAMTSSGLHTYKRFDLHSFSMTSKPLIRTRAHANGNMVADIGGPDPLYVGRLRHRQALQADFDLGHRYDLKALNDAAMR